MIGAPAGGSEESDFAALLAARPEINAEENAARRRVLVPLDSGRFCHDSASSTIQSESEAAPPIALRWLFPGTKPSSGFSDTAASAPRLSTRTCAGTTCTREASAGSAAVAGVAHRHRLAESASASNTATVDELIRRYGAARTSRYLGGEIGSLMVLLTCR